MEFDIKNPRTIVFGNILKELEARLQALFNLPTCSNYSITNYGNFPIFFLTFESMEWGE